MTIHDPNGLFTKLLTWSMVMHIAGGMRSEAKSMRSYLLAAALCLSLTQIAVADTYLIDTAQQYVGSVGEFGFNAWQHQYAGQTLTVDEPASISGFSFLASSYGGIAVVQGYLATWAGNEPGSILFESAPIDVLLASPYYPQHTEIGFTFAPIQLSPSSEYIAFLRFRKQSTDGWTWPGSVYLDLSGNSIDGGLVIAGSTGYDRNEISLSDAYWGQMGSIDTSMKVMLASPVPAPATHVLMMTGLGLLGFMARRKKPSCAA